MDGDLIPHASRAPKRPAPRAPSPTPTAEPTPPTTPRPRPRPRGRRREVVFGVALAIVAAIVITWWVTSAREPKPTLVNSLPTEVGVPPTNISGGPSPTPSFGVTTPATASAAESRRTLTTTYEAMHNVYEASRSYQTISLTTLGQLLPNLTIEEGTASSTNEQVVSLLTPAPDRVVLAVRDDAGCQWLRDYGSGEQIAVQHQVVVTCSAAAAPTTGWQTV